MDKLISLTQLGNLAQASKKYAGGIVSNLATTVTDAIDEMETTTTKELQSIREIAEQAKATADSLKTQIDSLLTRIQSLEKYAILDSNYKSS